jgi:ElaB/YqjD/DUF883 family membrane-anchored ribosome-binding protein
VLFEAKFHKEASDRAQVIIDNLAKLAATIDSFLSGEAKANKGTLTELKRSLTSATQQIKSNIPYVLEVASEQLEKKISSAVIEFESYVSQSLQAKGLSNLIADAPRLTIGEKKALPDGEQESE